MLISDCFFSEAPVVSVFLITGSFIVKESSYFTVPMVSVVSVLSAFKYSEALLFVVKQTERWDEDDHRVVDTYRLEAAPLKRVLDLTWKKRILSITKMRLGTIQGESGKTYLFHSWLLHPVYLSTGHQNGSPGSPHSSQISTFTGDRCL